MALFPKKGPELQLVVSASDRPHTTAADNAALGQRRCYPCRPSDTLETWWVEPNAGLGAVAIVAARASLDFDTMLAVTVERALTLADLEHAGIADAADRLDARAHAARADLELCGASSVYLQRLLHGENKAGPVRVGATSFTVCLPARLSDRLTDPAALCANATTTAIMGALSWEIAAVVSGRTITEWALAAELGCLGHDAQAVGA